MKYKPIVRIYHPDNDGLKTVADRLAVFLKCFSSWFETEVIVSKHFKEIEITSSGLGIKRTEKIESIIKIILDGLLQLSGIKTKKINMKKNVKTSKPYAQILSSYVKSFSVSKGFYVRYLSGNGEVLSHSETMKAKASCFKNIVAHISLSKGKEMIVVDNTTKKPTKYVVRFDGVKLRWN